jgi:hypothetical protein
VIEWKPLKTHDFGRSISGLARSDGAPLRNSGDESCKVFGAGPE